jgi:hypothetical protein
MRAKFAYIFVAFFLAAAWLPQPLRGLENFGLKEDIYIGKGEVQKSVIAFGGNVTVEGRVKENIIAFGGTITISGEVGDSVVGFGSAIILHSTAVVEGDVVSLGGTLTKEPGCFIQRDTVYFKGGEVISKLFRGGLFSFPLIPLILMLKLIAFFIWALLAIVIAALFPRQLALASAEIRTSFWPVFGTGALALILFAGLVIVAALLCLLLIGIPILMFLIAVGIAIKIFGEVVLFCFFGESVGRAFGSRTRAPLAAVMLGLIVVSFIKLVPILGFIASFFLSFIAWGVVIRTKFGTTENWLKRKA